MRTISCDRCGRIGHSARECPAEDVQGSDEHTEDQYRDHMARIDAIHRDWAAGNLVVSEKRRRIAAENEIYYRGTFKSAVTGETITRLPRQHDEIASILATAAGIPAEAAVAALNVRRRAGYHAAYADSLTEARQILESGASGYAQMLRAAQPGAAADTSWPADIREALGWPQPGTEGYERAVAAQQATESRRHRENVTTTGDTT